jgi:hypothetical protein
MAIRGPVVRAATSNDRKLVSEEFEEYWSANTWVMVFSNRNETLVARSRIALMPRVNVQLAA